MEYLVVAQSHYRAMALLTHDMVNLDKIATAKAAFADHLAAIEQRTSPDMRGILVRVRQANDRFNATSAQVLQLEQAGRDTEAMQLHLDQEHPVSHDVESATAALQASAEQEMTSSRDAFESGRQLLTTVVATFAALGVAAALLLGFVLSWSFVLPLRRITHALGRIASGHFGEQVDIRNRDEFGSLWRQSEQHQPAPGRAVCRAWLAQCAAARDQYAAARAARGTAARPRRPRP
ncbi:MAG TPA: HAMP domain-containing protein [Chloroflexota bacterium]